MADTYKFVYQNRVDVYVQRILDASSTFFGYSADVMLKSEKGWMVMCRTYPRHPLWEETNESKPQWTRSGRLETYRIEPEAIEYGENFISHREGPECTPYLPNAIMTTNPYVRPDDYGIPITAQHHDDKTVRNIKLPWQEIKRHPNPLWEKGYQFYCVTPKTRHRVHSQWSVNDWVQIYESNFGDPYRMDKRTPGVGEHQIHINPQAAKDRGINDGDYVLCRREPGGPALSRLEAVGSVLQGRPFDDPGEIQSFVSVPRHDGQACPVCLDGEVGEGARDAAGRTRDCGGHRLSVQLPVRRSTVVYQELAHADAPDRLIAGQTGECLEVQVGLRNRSPRGQHGAEGMLDPHHQGGRRRHRSPWALGTSPDRLHAGSGKRVHDQVAERGTYQDQGVDSTRAIHLTVRVRDRRRRAFRTQL